MGLLFWRKESENLYSSDIVKMGLKLSNIGCPLIESQIKLGKVLETCFGTVLVVCLCNDMTEMLLLLRHQ